MRASRRRIRARMNPGSDRDAERSTDESRRGPLRDARARSAADAAPRDDEAWRAPSFKTAPGAARGALRARQSCCNFFRSPLSFPRRFASPRSDKRRARPPTRSSPRGAPSSRAPWRSPRSGFPPRSLADALARTLVRPRPGAASRDLARLPPRRHPSAPRPPPPRRLCRAATRARSRSWARSPRPRAPPPPPPPPRATRRVWRDWRGSSPIPRWRWRSGTTSSTSRARRPPPPRPRPRRARVLDRRPRRLPRRPPPVARRRARVRGRRERVVGAREATSPAAAAARDAVALQLALALGNRAFALGALGDWPGALDSSRRALGALGAAGPTAKIADVPTTSPASGLRGGAPTVAQRLAFRAALARWGAGDVAGAANADRLDLGPEPDPGFPQFWEARAALAAAMWASGAKPRAEAEWARLCEATRPNPPATPTDGVRAAVNRAAQMQFDGYGALMDKRCEDFATGTPLPCDDAGIPGAGGARRRAACSRSRRWRAGGGRGWPRRRSRRSSRTGRSTSSGRARWRGGERGGGGGGGSGGGEGFHVGGRHERVRLMLRAIVLIPRVLHVLELDQDRGMDGGVERGSRRVASRAALLAPVSPPPVLADAPAPALLAHMSHPPVLADLRAPALLAVASLPPVLAEFRASALLALVSLPPVLADLRAPALLARDSPPPVLAEARAPALLALASPPPVLADARAPALLARMSLPPVLADAPTPALFAHASLPPVLADARAPALLARMSHPPVLADARAPALLARMSLPPVLADPSPRALLAEIPSPSHSVHASIATRLHPGRARTLPEGRGHSGTRGGL